MNKKFLNIILGLSFIWKVLANEVEIKACSEYIKEDLSDVLSDCRSINSHDTFCIYGTDIYSLDSNNACRSGFTLELTDSSLNLVKIDGSASESNFSSEIAGLTTNPENYILVDCDATSCKQTQGYLLSSDKKTIYKFINNNVGAVASNDESIDDDSKCVDSPISNIGIIGKKGTGGVYEKICIKNGKALDFSTTETKYMILRAEGAVGTPFLDEGYNVALKVDPYYIIKDQFYTAVNLVTKADGSVITNFSTTDTDLTPTDYDLIDCVDGVCKQTNGYVINNTQVIGFIDGTGSVDDSKFVVMEYCNENRINNIGKYVKNLKTFCNGPGATDYFRDTWEYQQWKGIKISENIILGNYPAAEGTPFRNVDNNVLIKNDTNYFIIDKFDSVNLVLWNSIYVYKDIYLLDLNDIDENVNQDQWKGYYIIDCVNGVCRKTSGYFKKGDTVYKFVNKSKNKHIDEATDVANGVTEESECNDDTIGQLIKDKSAVCINNKMSVKFVKDSVEYMIKGGSAEYGPFVSSDSHFLKTGVNYVVVDAFTNIAAPTDYTGTDKTTIALYDCNDSNICFKTPGYVYDSSNYYPVSTTCGVGAAIDVGDGTATCSNENVGKIVKVTDTNGEEHNYLCLDKDIGVNVDIATISSSEGRYLITGITATGSVFSGTNLPIKIDTGSKSIRLDKTLNDDLYRIYGTNVLQDNRVENFCTGTVLDNLYTCSNGQCEKKFTPCGPGKYIVETSTDNYNLFECITDEGGETRTCTIDTKDEDNGILLANEQDNENEYTVQKVEPPSILLNANADLSNYKFFVYDCVRGICKPTEALIRYGETPATGYCGVATKCVVPALEGDIINLGNIGKVSYTSSNFKLTRTVAPTETITIEEDSITAHAGTSNAFVVIQNVDDVIAAKRKILDTTLYVKTSDHTLVLEGEYTLCSEDIKKYTSVNTETDTATGADCIPPECRLSLTASDNRNCAEGYYLKSTVTTGTNNGKLVKTDTEPGILYYCKESEGMLCDTVKEGDFKPGYYQNADTINKSTIQYFKCPTLATCQAVHVSETECSSAKVGGLITNGEVSEVISICVDDAENSIPLIPATEDADVEVFISIDTTNGADAFGDQENDKYVLVDVDVIKCVRIDDKLPYRYTGPDQKLVKRTKRVSVCESKGTMREFKKGEDNNYTRTK